DMVIDRNGHFFVSLRNATTAESRGVLRSTDRGTTWTRVLGLPLPGFNTGRAADLEVASNGDVYASLGILSRSEVYKSSFAAHGVNTGAPGTWINITPSTPTVTQRVEIAVAPSDPQRVYLFMQDSATSQVLNVYRSVNGGISWASLPAPTALNNGANSQTWFNLIAAVDPANPDFIVAGGLDLARSTDGGNTWTTITTASTVHVDHHVLIFDGSSKLINGNDGGVYYCSNIQAANPVFVPKNKGYNVTQFYAADLHPGAGVNYFLAGAQDNGNQKFTQSGMNSTSAITGGDGGFCQIDQSNPQLQIVATTNNNYARSLNGGNSFSSLGSSINNDRGQFINPSDFDEAAKILYAGDDAGKYYCISGLNGTPTAISVASGAFGNQEVTAIKVDPFSPNTIWLGVSFGTPAGLPRVLKLSNANTSNPTVITVANIGNVANAAISCIDVDLNDANRILVTLSNFGVNSVWLSTNGGTVFSSIEGNLPDMPVRWGMFAPPNAELSGPGGGVGGILLATELGVWTTSQMLGAATQWIPNNSGLANVRTDMLRYRSSDHLLIAATHGRGLFSTTLPTIVTGIVNPPPATRDFIKFVSAQHNTLLIEPGTLSVTSYTVQIFTMQGQLLYEKQFPYRSVMLNLKPYPPGAYVLRCRGNRGEIYQQKFIR
ncbi:MAG: T9SS type A sorting domain-containing protein, partial [Chitinophagaceae bacterium]|nr:T9SS type A sorting domain-containing protein [Chitinophagaceae bacterium]